MYARTAPVGAVPLSAAPKALGAILGALAAPEAAAPLAGVDVELQIVVAFDDSDEFEAEDFQSSDVVWRAAGRCVVRSGEDTANAEKTVADAVRAAESRLARRAFAQFGRARCDRRGGPPQAPRSSLERCAAAGLFALRFASDNRARSVVVATDGNGVGAPAVCGLLGAGGRRRDCRRSGCRLHVLDYGGGLSAGAGEANRNSREPSPDGVDDPVVQALGAGDDDDDDADDSCFGLAPDWASVALRARGRPAPLAAESLSAPPEAPSPIHRPLFLEESPGERTLALEAPARSPRGALAGGDASSDVYREQLAAYPLPNVELRDLASLRATGALDLRVVRFAMPAPRQRFASTRDPIVLAWELPKFDDTTLRYTVELRPPGHGDLVAEARRRSGAPRASRSSGPRTSRCETCRRQPGSDRGAPTTPNGRAGRSSGVSPTSACNGWPCDFDREAVDEPERRARALEDEDEARRARRRTFGETGEGLLEESDRSRTRSPSGSRVSGASSDDDALLRWDRGGRRDAPKARRLRDLAAALLRQDGALVAMAAASLPGLSTPLAKVAKSSPKGSSRPPVGSFLDETVELGDISEDPRGQALDDCCGACALDGTEDDGLAWCAVEDGVAMVAALSSTERGEELTFAEVDARAVADHFAAAAATGSSDLSPAFARIAQAAADAHAGEFSSRVLGLLRERPDLATAREVRDALDWCDWTGGRRANAALAGERALARADALAAAAAGCWDRAGFLRLGALTGGDGDSYAFVGPRRGEDPLSEGEDGRTTPQVGDEPYTPPPSVGRLSRASSFETVEGALKSAAKTPATIPASGGRLSRTNSGERLPDDDEACGGFFARRNGDEISVGLARPRPPEAPGRESADAPKDAARLACEGVECKIDIVAYGGDDAGVAGKRMPPNLETFFAAALCERWAADDAKPAPSRGATNEAFARVERSLKRIAFRRAGDAYVAVDARDERRPPEGYFASVRVDECQIHYSARQADVVAVPQRRYGRAAYARGGAGTYAMGRRTTPRGRRAAAPRAARRPARRCRRRRATRRARASCRRAGPGDAGTQARGDALRRRRGLTTTINAARLRGKTADDEAKDREAVARALRCALSRASRVASQLRLLGAVVATRLAHELLVPAGGDGAADVDVSPFSCDLLDSAPVRPFRARSWFASAADALTHLERAFAEGQCAKAANAVTNRTRFYASPKAPATPPDGAAVVGGSECYARLWANPAGVVELRLFGARPFSDAAVAVKLKCAFVADVDDCARRAFTADFFAGDPEARAPLDVDGDDLALLLAERPTRAAVAVDVRAALDAEARDGCCAAVVAACCRRAASGAFDDVHFSSRPGRCDAGAWADALGAPPGGVQVVLATTYRSGDPGFRVGLADLRLAGGEVACACVLVGVDDDGAVERLKTWLTRAALRAAGARAEIAAEAAEAARGGRRRVAVGPGAAADVVPPRGGSQTWRVFGAMAGGGCLLATLRADRRSLRAYGARAAPGRRRAAAATALVRARQRCLELAVARAGSSAPDGAEPPPEPLPSTGKKKRSRKKNRRPASAEPLDPRDFFRGAGLPWWRGGDGDYEGALDAAIDDASSDDAACRAVAAFGRRAARRGRSNSDDVLASAEATVLQVAARLRGGAGGQGTRRSSDARFDCGPARRDSSDSSEEGDGEDRRELDRSSSDDDGPEDVAVGEAYACALAFRFAALAEWTAPGGDVVLERVNSGAAGDVIRDDRTGATLTLALSLERYDGDDDVSDGERGRPASLPRRSRSRPSGAAPLRLVARARAGDLSTRGGEYATARTLLGKTKIDYAARTFAARLAVASARRRRLLRRRDARTLLFADVLCRKEGDLLTVRRLTGSAFDDFSRRRRRAPETPGADDDEDRERRHAESPAGDGALGVAGGPGGVRLARGGGALVAVAELRSEVVAYGLGLPAAGSPEERAFWDACRAVTEKARRKAEARKAEDELRTLALDRRSLRRYGAYYARRPLAAWNSRIALLLRRDGAPDGDLRVPWRDVLAAAARDGNPVVEPRGGDPHRDAWVVPLVTRADRGGASHCLVAVHCRWQRRAAAR
ncbi:hypothetical protein JL721_468 [Aureococcus anophagefferens]|nr:hypothetical protein JL721_468 [Aureococcus anophagefferens]